MRRFHVFGAALMVPVLVIFLAGLGCGGGSKNGGGGGAGTGGGGGTGGSGTAGGEKTAIEAKGVATLKGKVTYDGDPPKLPDYKAQMQGQKDKEVCLAGDTSNQTWKVKNGAVANVVVWIKAPSGKFFQLPSDMTNLNGKDVVLDQPHCAFEPHVFLLFPKYYDATTKSYKTTGQKLKVKNSAPMLHNTTLVGSSLKNPAKNETLASKQEPRIVPIDLDTQYISLKCNVHNWMNGYGWTFDHPFAAVSKGDRKEDDMNYGAYEIAKVPAGVALEVWAWHEANPNFTVGVMSAAGAPNGVKIADMTFKDGENTLDIKVKK